MRVAARSAQADLQTRERNLEAPEEQVKRMEATIWEDKKRVFEAPVLCLEWRLYNPL